MAYLHETLAQAGEAVIIKQIPALGGDGGAIIRPRTDRLRCRSTPGMARGWIGSDGVPHIALYSAIRCPCRTPPRRPESFRRCPVDRRARAACFAVHGCR